MKPQSTDVYGIVDCQRCQVRVMPLIKDNGPHKEARCPLCGMYIKFLKKTEYRVYQALKEASDAGASSR